MTRVKSLVQKGVSRVNISVIGLGARVAVAVGVAAGVVVTRPATAADVDAANSVLQSGSALQSRDADAATYVLRYKLQPGENIHYEVTHTAKTKTRINGSEETSDMSTTSRRHWDVKTAADQKMTFGHVLDKVAMTQTTDDAPATRWDSSQSIHPPEAFAPIAEKIGTELSTITINPRGQQLDRESDTDTQTDLGMGSLTVAFPETPLKIGDSWSVPRQIRVREDNEQKVIKIRELYTLIKVRTGVATLTVRSEPLTPINSQSVAAQVVQHLSNGELRFDIDAGRLIEKRLDWDENVVSFRGPNSEMNYRATLIERMVPDGQVRSARR